MGSEGWHWAVMAALFLAVLAPPASAERRAARPEEGVLPGGNLLACETYSVHRLFATGEMDLETFPRLMKELRIKGLALNDFFFPSWEKEYLDRVKAAAKGHGRVMVALVMGGNLATGDEAARRRSIEDIKMKMEAAKYLGAKVVRMDTGSTGMGAEADATIGVERVKAALMELLPLARRLRLRMTMENHGGVSASADNILRIIQGTDPRWVGACLDFGNWPAELRYESCQKLAPYTYHTHAKSHSFREDGEEANIDYGRILRMLKAAKCRAALSIEFEGPGDPVEGVKKTRDLIIKHWPR